MYLLECMNLNKLCQGFLNPWVKILKLKQFNVVLYIIDHKDDYQFYSKIHHSTLAFA
jgi:hypothetical protein